MTVNISSLQSYAYFEKHTQVDTDCTVEKLLLKLKVVKYN